MALVICSGQRHPDMGQLGAAAWKERRPGDGRPELKAGLWHFQQGKHLVEAAGVISCC